MAQYFRLAGDPERAIESGQRALSTAQSLADHVLEADTNYRLAQACRSQGNYRQAAWYLSRNIDLLEGSGLPDPPSKVPDILVLSRIQLAHCLGELGEMHRAIATGQYALRLAESMKRDDLIAGAHCGLGTAYLAKGEVDNAITALEYSCRLCHLRELRILLVWAESPLGHAYRMAGRLDEAVACLEQAVERAAFLKHSQAARVVQLGYGYLDQGRLTKALEIAQRGLDLAGQHKERGHEGLALRLFGEIYARHDPHEDELAWTYYRQALERANDLGMRPLAAHSHRGIGKLCLRTGKADRAHEYFTTATAMYREMDMGFWLEQVERDALG